MDTKISKIKNFLVSLEQEELTEEQMSMMLKGGLPGEIGPPGTDNCGCTNLAANCSGGRPNRGCVNRVANCGGVSGSD